MTEQLSKPRRIPLDSGFWTCAMAIAVLRMASNEGIREPERDRGQTKNLLNDLQGAAGELAARLKVEIDLAGTGNVVSGPLLSESGPVDDVDVIITSDGSAIRLEAKCLLWSQGKSRFLINVRAHERSMRRQASGYLPVFAKVAGSTAVVGGVIPMTDVHGWKREAFQYKDPALSLPLDDCARRYFGKSWPVVLGYLGAPGACGIDEATLMITLPNAVASARAELLPVLTRPTSSIAGLCAEVDRLVHRPE